MPNQGNPNANPVGQHIANNTVTKPGNKELDIMLEKEEVYLGGDLGSGTSFSVKNTVC